MKVRLVLVLASLFVGSLAFSQMGPEHGRGPGSFRPLGMHTGKVVTGQPYSATVTNTVTRILPDGNTITRTTTGTVYRDSAGRTATTETISGMFGQSGTKTITFITDPVTGVAYTLNPDTKTATRRTLHQPNGHGQWAARENSKPANPNVQTEDKGVQMINGVNVQGKATTRTIPAGAIGNAKPIAITSETWYSPDLQVVVSSTRTDPREGTMMYALTNIQRAEPAASVFQVPSDYTIKDAPKFGDSN